MLIQTNSEREDFLAFVMYIAEPDFIKRDFSILNPNLSLEIVDWNNIEIMAAKHKAYMNMYRHMSDVMTPHAFEIAEVKNTTDIDVNAMVILYPNLALHPNLKPRKVYWKRTTLAESPFTNRIRESVIRGYTYEANGDLLVIDKAAQQVRQAIRTNTYISDKKMTIIPKVVKVGNDKFRRDVVAIIKIEEGSMFFTPSTYQFALPSRITIPNNS